MRSYSILFIKGVFIIYEKGGGISENLKISIFFRIPPKIPKFFSDPPPLQVTTKYLPPSKDSVGTRDIKG